MCPFMPDPWSRIRRRSRGCELQVGRIARAGVRGRVEGVNLFDFEPLAGRGFRLRRALQQRQVQANRPGDPVMELGKIVRLQVQRSSLKVMEDGRKRYDPTPIQPVTSLLLSPGGVTGYGEDGEQLADVHHRDHPQSKFRGDNGLSILFTPHYRALRDRFGDHLTDGIAGETILVQTANMVPQEALRNGVVIHTSEGVRVLLEDVCVAEPCVEFTRYSLRYAPQGRSDVTVADALRFLRAGTRGYYARYGGTSATLRLGDAVLLP